MASLKQRYGLIVLLLGIVAIVTSKAFALPTVEMDDRLEQILNEFATEYPKLHIPPVELEYVSNLKNMGNPTELDQQNEFFKTLLRKLNSLKSPQLSIESNIKFIWFKSIVDDNLDRIRLEKDFKHSGTSIPEGGLFSLPNHKQWYALYIRRFASRNLIPSKIRRLGLSEVARIRTQMLALQSELGYAGRDYEFNTYLNSDAFQMHDQVEVMQGYESIKSKVLKNLASLFPWVTTTPFNIAPVPDANKDTPPGIYKRGDKTFYFSFYEQKHNKRAMEWLLLHEAVPGHHYQYSVEDKSELRPPFAKWFKNYGYVEGWAAYVETLGQELNLYKDKTSTYGRLEWDLIRSIRLAIDEGIHAHGWSKKRATEFWKKHIPNRLDIAEREIDRIIRWPAQAISYKTGEQVMNELETLLKGCLKSSFDRKRFHELILERGNMPFSALKAVFANELKTQGCP